MISNRLINLLMICGVVVVAALAPIVIVFCCVSSSGENGGKKTVGSFDCFSGDKLGNVISNSSSYGFDCGAMMLYSVLFET